MTVSGFDFAKIGVMVVDDNRNMRALLCSILHALGFKRIKEVADGESALEEIPQFCPDIIITDWHMEPMNGIELVKNIRASGEDQVRYLPIIMLSGHSEAERVRGARDAGAHEFLAKPISAKSLFARIIRIVDSPRPFVKTDFYFGPDRRRQDLGPEAGMPDRRQGAKATDVAPTDAAPAEMPTDAADADTDADADTGGATPS